MNAYITYDITARHSEVKSEMKKIGYLDQWTDDNKVAYYLPNTTLWKKDRELADAVKDLQRVIAALNNSKTYTQPTIVLERCIAVNAFPWVGIQGIPHKS